MSFTNKTANYDLPQYIATDKPSYLVDANGAYLAIDTAMKANETAAATAQNTADTNTAAISTLNTQINGEDGLASDLTAVETLAGTTAGAVQTINQVIGSGTPTTTAQTLIGAINELDSENNGKLNSPANSFVLAGSSASSDNSVCFFSVKGVYNSEDCTFKITFTSASILYSIERDSDSAILVTKNVPWAT